MLSYAPKTFDADLHVGDTFNFLQVITNGGTGNLSVSSYPASNFLSVIGSPSTVYPGSIQNVIYSTGTTNGTIFLSILVSDSIGNQASVSATIRVYSKIFFFGVGIISLNYYKQNENETTNQAINRPIN